MQAPRMCHTEYVFFVVVGGMRPSGQYRVNGAKSTLETNCEGVVTNSEAKQSFA